MADHCHVFKGEKHEGGGWCMGTPVSSRTIGFFVTLVQVIAFAIFGAINGPSNGARLSSAPNAD